MIDRSNASPAGSTALALGLSCLGLAFGTAIYRIHFGVDFFDEPYYAALAYRFVCGQRPFVDELGMAQTFALLTAPWVWLGLAIRHTPEGILLWLRWGYVAAYLALALGLARLARRWIGVPAALAVGACCVLFPPTNILTLSYNTLGALLLTAGLFALARWAIDGRGNLFAVGLALGLATLAYPTLVVVSFALGVDLLLATRRYRPVLAYALGAIVVLGPFGIFVLGHRAAFGQALAFMRAEGYGSTRPDWVALLFSRQLGLLLAVLAAYPPLAALIRRRQPGLTLALVASIPLVPVLLCHFVHRGWNLYPCLLAGLAPAFLGLGTDRAFTRRLLLYLWLPSAFAGLVVAMTSGIGIERMQVGMLPGALSTLVLCARLLPSRWPRPAWLATAIVGLPILLCLKYPLAPYDDDGMAILSAKVENGPYRGLWTVPERARIAESLERELPRFLQAKGRLLVYDNFPSAYLMSGMPPANGSVWANDRPSRGLIAQRYATDLHPGNRVVRMKYRYYTPGPSSPITYAPTDPLNRLVESTHTQIFDSDLFSVFEIPETR